MASRVKERAFKVSWHEDNSHSNDRYHVETKHDASLKRRVTNYVFARVLAGEKVRTSEVARLVANINRRDTITSDDEAVAQEVLSSLAMRHRTIRQSIEEDTCI